MRPTKGRGRKASRPKPPGFAGFFAPDDAAQIVIGRRPITPGMTLQSWITTMTKSRTMVYSGALCRPPESVRAYRFDGEAAQLRVLHCPGVSATGGGALVLAVHQNYGYALACFSQETGAGAPFTQQCLNWLSTFRFAL